MATQRTIDEADIRRRCGQWAEAICGRDIEGVMSLYAPQIVSFDLDPPPQYTGVEAKRSVAESRAMTGILETPSCFWNF